MKFLSRRGDARLVLVAHADKDFSAIWQSHAAAELRLREGDTEGSVDAHHLTRRFHFRTEQRIDAGKLVKWKDRFLDRNMCGVNFARQAEISELISHHNSRRDFCQWHSDRFADEGHRPRRARIDFENEHVALLHGELHVHQTAHVERFG